MQSPRDRTVRPWEMSASEPAALPSGFEWCRIDAGDPVHLRELVAFLKANYIEATNAMGAQYRMQITTEFMEWCLNTPYNLLDGVIGIRATASGKLMAFLSCTPMHTLFKQAPLCCTHVNFLCVHRKLRNKRILPTIVREAARMGMVHDIPQGAYTSERLLHEPIAVCRYHLRVLDPVAVARTDFVDAQTMSRLQWRLPVSHKTRGLRAMTAEDAPAVRELLRAQVAASGLEFAPEWRDVAEVAHRLLARPGSDIVATLVACDASGAVTDMISYYVIVLKCGTVELRMAYQYYRVAATVPLTQLVTDAMLHARDAGCHVYNMLDIQDNAKCFRSLGFAPGSPANYFMTCMSTPRISSEKIGIILP